MPAGCTGKIRCLRRNGGELPDFHGQGEAVRIMSVLRHATRRCCQRPAAVGRTRRRRGAAAGRSDDEKSQRGDYAARRPRPQAANAPEFSTRRTRSARSKAAPAIPPCLGLVSPRPPRSNSVPGFMASELIRKSAVRHAGSPKTSSNDRPASRPDLSASKHACICERTSACVSPVARPSSTAQSRAPHA